MANIEFGPTNKSGFAGSVFNLSHSFAAVVGRVFEHGRKRTLLYPLIISGVALIVVFLKRRRSVASSVIATK